MTQYRWVRGGRVGRVRCDGVVGLVPVDVPAARRPRVGPTRRWLPVPRVELRLRTLRPRAEHAWRPRRLSPVGASAARTPCPWDASSPAPAPRGHAASPLGPAA